MREIDHLYDAIMAEIEPELMSQLLPELDRIYAQETPEERAARMERYRKAFELCEERVQAVVGEWQAELEQFKRQAIAERKQESVTEDQSALRNIEQSFSKEA